MGTLDQRNYRIGDPDNIYTDYCSYDFNSTPRAEQAKQVNFIVRIQVAEDSGVGTALRHWQLFVNDVNNLATAWQVTTTSDDVISTSDTPITNPSRNVCATQAETWRNGDLVESAARSKLLRLLANRYTEFAWVVQFTAAAKSDTTYYFWLLFNGNPLTDTGGTYDNVAQVTTMASSSSSHSSTSSVSSSFSSSSGAVSSSSTSFSSSSSHSPSSSNSSSSSFSSS